MRPNLILPTLLLALPGAALAQSAAAPGSATTAHPHVHHAAHHTAAHHAVAHCAPSEAATVDAAPVLPPGVPPSTGPLQTAFALRYIDLQPGTGAPMQPGDFLTVQYTGWLASNGMKFDSSVDRNEPFTFEQGEHRVIPGWDEGLNGMRIGGKRRLFVPWQLAYGEMGRGPIPPKADLIFDVELLAASPEPPTAPVPPPAPSAPVGSTSSAPGQQQPQR